MFTYGIFYDLLDSLNTEHHQLYLPVAIEIAINEKNLFMECALSLIGSLDNGYFTTVDKRSIKKLLKSLYKKLFFANPYYKFYYSWNALIFNFFDPNERTKYLLRNKNWRKLVPKTLPCADDLGIKSCPNNARDIKITASIIAMEEEIKGKLVFNRNSIYKGSTFWFFKFIDNSKYPFFNYSIYAVLNSKGEFSVHTRFLSRKRKHTIQNILGHYLYEVEGKL
jgi:hypothetical protein